MLRSAPADQGLGVAAGGLTFKKVFERVEVTTGVQLTTASVIRRLWEDRAEFREAVLTAVALEGDAGDESGRRPTRCCRWSGRSTAEGRLRGPSEVCRLGRTASLQALVDPRSWSPWVDVWVLGVTGTPWERVDRVRRPLLDGDEATAEPWMGLHGALADVLGLRLREPLAPRQFTVSVGAPVEGCVLRGGTGRELAVILRPTGPGGAVQEWILFAVGLEALAHRHLELDPGRADPAGAD